MRWPIMLRSTHEKVLHEHRQIARQLNIDAWKQWCTQRDATRAAQKGLLRLQRRMKARSRPSTHAYQPAPENNMQGKRVELVPQPGGYQLLEPGEYGKWTDGTWQGCTPNGYGANLSQHTVIEHEDGTITVTPSILVSVHDKPLWHGYLTRGVWCEC